MREDWEIKKLGEVIEIRNGKNQQGVLSETGQYPILGSGGNIMGYATDYICEAGTTIIGRKGNISKPIFINEKFWNVDTAFGLYPKDNLPERFVYYTCLNIDFGSMNRGTTIPSLVKTELLQIPIHVPKSLQEQQRIVAILDEAFIAIAKAKANAQQNLQNAKELFESYLQNTFSQHHRLKGLKEHTESPLKASVTSGLSDEIRDSDNGEVWEEKTLVEVLLKTETIDPTKNPSKEFIYLDVSSVNKETKEIESATVILGKDAPSRARKLIRKNDVIFATVRPTHSRVALITEKYDKQVCSTGYFVLRTKEFLNNNLVYYFLLTYGFNKQMEKLQKGASYPAVTDAEVKSIIIAYPKSLKTQQTIVKKLDALSIETKKLEAIYQQKINDLEELKKSILQKAFSGDLKTMEKELSNVSLK